MLPVFHIAISFLAILAASTVMGTVSFGMGTVAGPILLLIHDPWTTVVTCNALGAFVVAMVLVQTRHYIRLRSALPLTIGGMFGVPVGVRMLSIANQGPLRLAIGVITLAMIIPYLIDFFRSQLGRTTPFGQKTQSKISENIRRVTTTLTNSAGSPWLGPFAGFLGALLVAAFGVGGGPLVAVYVLFNSRTLNNTLSTNGDISDSGSIQDSHQHNVQSIRSTLAFFWVINNSEAVLVSWASGLVTLERLSMIGFLTIPAIIGFGVATMILGKINERAFRGITLTMIIIASLTVITRELSGF